MRGGRKGESEGRQAGVILAEISKSEIMDTYRKDPA